MRTIKEVVMRRVQLEAQIGVSEIVLSNIYDTPGLKEKYGEKWGGVVFRLST